MTPPSLQPGDTVAITCPAKKLPVPIDDAVRLLESWGLKVKLGRTISASHNQYAGDDDLRTHDLQQFLDDPSIKAIFAARGGYGTIRILDRLDFSTFMKAPKWIIGFSDITVLHSHVFACFGIETIHGQMPLTIPDGTKPSLETLRKSLFGEKVEHAFKSTEQNRSGEAEGILIGGNLSLLITVTGSVSDINYTDKILFIEDVGEYLYSIDRMMWNLRRSGKLALLKGLIVGGFTDSLDNEIPFGKTAEQIIMEHVEDFKYPVCFDFPAGHIADNRALILGAKVKLRVSGQDVNLSYSLHN